MVIMANNQFKNIDYHLLQEILELKYKVTRILMCDANIPRLREKLAWWEYSSFMNIINPCNHAEFQPSNADESILEQISIRRHEANKIVLWTQDHELQQEAKEIVASTPQQPCPQLKIVEPLSFFDWHAWGKKFAGRELYIPMSQKETGHTYSRKRAKAKLQQKNQIPQIVIGGHNVIQVIQNQDGTNYGQNTK